MFRGRSTSPACHYLPRTGQKAETPLVVASRRSASSHSHRRDELLDSTWAVGEGGWIGRALLTAGSEKHEVLQTGSIHGAILLSCRFLYNRAF